MRLILSKYMYVKHRNIKVIVPYLNSIKEIKVTMYIRNRYIICIQKDAGNLSPPYMYPLSPSTHNASRTHSHTSQNTPILLWKQVHIAVSLLHLLRMCDTIRVFIPWRLLYRPHPMKKLIKNILMAIIKKSLVFKHFLRFRFTLYTSILYQKT